MVSETEVRFWVVKDNHYVPCAQGGAFETSRWSEAFVVANLCSGQGWGRVICHSWHDAFELPHDLDAAASVIRNLYCPGLVVTRECEICSEPLGNRAGGICERCSDPRPTVTAEEVERSEGRVWRYYFDLNRIAGLNHWDRHAGYSRVQAEEILERNEVIYACGKLDVDQRGIILSVAREHPGAKVFFDGSYEEVKP